jgi:tetratricopeptide (TPR) repeat protein
MRAEWDEALAAAGRAAAAARDAELPDQAAEALNVEAMVHQARGDFAVASELFEQILAVRTSDRVRGAALQNLGSIAAQRGDFETARQRFLASHQCFRRAGYLRGEAVVLANFGRAAVDCGNFRVAVDMLKQAVSAAKRLGNSELAAITTMNYAEALAGLRDFDQAYTLASGALEHFTATGNSWRRVECLRLLGDIRRDRGEVADAEQTYASAIADATAIGAAAELELLHKRRAALGGAAG